jgi:hypothetical protein
MRSQASHSGKALKAAVLAGLAGLACVLSTGAGQAQSIFRGVQIDMSGLPSGAAETRRDLQACLSTRLPAALAGRVNPGARSAPILVVRPTSVWLASVVSAQSSEDDRGGGGTSSLDQLEGEAIVAGQRIPLLVSANPDFGTQGAAIHNARIRTDTLCTSFAYWIARKV